MGKKQRQVVVDDRATETIKRRYDRNAPTYDAMDRLSMDDILAMLQRPSEGVANGGL